MTQEFTILRDLYEAVGEDNPFWVESGQYKAQFTKVVGKDNSLVLVYFITTVNSEHVSVREIACLDIPIDWIVTIK